MQNIGRLDTNNAGQAQPLIDAVQKQMGTVPHIFATMANSPAVLEGYLAFNGALASGTLSTAVKEQIALAVAGQNECDYCASAHTYLAQHAGVSKSEIRQNLEAKSLDPKTSVILSYVKEVVSKKGLIDPLSTDSLREAGVSDAEIVEIIAHIGMNIFTNYFNHIAGTEIDFPVVNVKAA